jgi:protein-L-isoaspartate(D-aspartate) O-methyltransferase
MQKSELIEYLISAGYLKTPAVIEAFSRVRREDFIPAGMKRYAYINEPLPIGHGQTISQPLTVAAMTEALDVRPGMKILEVGAGSGYQAAILSEIIGKNGKVITTERIAELYEYAKNNMKNFENVFVVHCDGSKGYEKEAPYDRIIVTASASSVPKKLVEQLKSGGKMVIPVGHEMYLIEKQDNDIRKTFMGFYAFVPLVED